MFGMDLSEIVSNFMKKALFQVTSFVSPNPVSSALRCLSSMVFYIVDKIILILIIWMAVLFRLTFGIWPQSLNVVPFEICAKDDYYEDPGVLEMRALLRGEDFNDEFVNRQQRLPFPQADFDPYDKIYLASYFHGLKHTILNIHRILLQYGGVTYQRINNFFVYKSFLNYISSRVAVNIRG